jgi:hypothetical protein
MGRGFAIGALAFVVVMEPCAIAAERARPPRWPREMRETFFDDARTQLDGPRPDYEQQSRPQANAVQRAADAASNSSDSDLWSRLISPATLETEIKRLAQSLQATVTTPGEFKAGGYKLARVDLSELAVLFAVIAQYDGDVRWKDIAAGMRGQFARAGLNAKVGTDQTYREAVERKEELASLVQGERPPVPKSDAAFDDWSQIASRPQLMQRINAAHEERLTKWLADAATFRRNRDAIRHEAQIVAMLAEVVHRKEYEYWDDESFVEYAVELRDAATEASSAAEADDFPKARDAVTRAGNACTECHAGYRG